MDTYSLVDSILYKVESMYLAAGHFQSKVKRDTHMRPTTVFSLIFSAYNSIGHSSPDLRSTKKV